MEIFNINSKYNISQESHRTIIKNTGFLSNIWNRVPIYLVDEELMDFLSPPSHGLGEKCVKEIIREFPDLNDWGDDYRNSNRLPVNNERINRFWRTLSECFSEQKYVSIGVYIQQLSTKKIQQIQDKMRLRIPFSPDLGESGSLLPYSTDLDKVPVIKELSDHLKRRTLTPDAFFDDLQEILDQHQKMVPNQEAIFICMERVVKAAEEIKQKRPFKGKDINELVQFVSNYIILHELLHAYLKTEGSRYRERWGRLIEESLVTAYGMAFFKDHPNYSALRIHLSTAPLEYRAYTFFENYSISELSLLLNDWKTDSAQKFFRICPPSDLVAHYGGRVRPWPDKDAFFERYMSDMCHPPENFWMVLGKEILRQF